MGGGDGIVERFGAHVYETLDELNENQDAFHRLLPAIAEGPLTETQIAERSAVSTSLVDHLIAKLSDVKLIRKDAQRRWATTVPVITDEHMRVIGRDVTPMASSVARYMKKETPQLKMLYENEKIALDPPWEDVTHLLIDKFIIDGSFHSGILELERERTHRQSGNGARDIATAFFLEQGDNFSSFGTNWYPFNKDGDQREVYVLHGAILNRYDLDN